MINLEPTSAVQDRSISGAPLLTALGLASAAVTAQQIALMQVLGWMHWHHFAYMVVAVALLGFGIAGTVLSLTRDRLVKSWEGVLPWLLAVAALATPIGVRLAQLDALAVDLPLVFFEPVNAWRLVALCALLLPPFLCVGLATGLVLTVHARNAGRYYAASLVGAGAGGLAGLALVACVAPPQLATAVAIIALAAVVPLWSHATLRARAAIVVIGAGLGTMWIAPGNLTSSQFKPLRRTLDLPEARIVASRPSVHGWIQIVAAPALRPSPAVSFEFREEISSQPVVFVNGIPHGSLLDPAAVRVPGWLDFTTDAAAFVATKPSRSVVLLENGPGGWAALASHHGASRIIVVEPNRTLVALLTNDSPAPAAEWRLPNVEMAAANGRAFLRRTRDKFDVIRFPMVGALGGTTGLASASEQLLLTREAFVDAWNRLAPEGVIAITTWMDFPERNPLRLVSTLAEAVESVGAPPRVHIAAVRGWATVTFLLRRSPWTDSSATALREFCTHRGFDPLLLPNLKSEERETHHTWQNPDFFRLVDALLDGPRQPVYRDHAFLLRPPTDDRPYFSQFMRWTKIDRLREIFGARAMPFFELGSLVVALTFGILGVLAIGCVLLPLAQIGWRAPGKTSVLLYFGGLGAGYMCVEIGLMLRAQAWLGSPMLAAAIVITTLLIASGVGSLWSERLPAEPRKPLFAVAIVIGGALIAALLFAGLDGVAHASPTWVQVALLLGIIIPLGLALGTAFPLGLRRLEASRPRHVPWAWAINGCASVVTPAGAMLLAMSAGFSALFVAAAAAYGLALAGALLNGETAMRGGSIEG